MEKLKYHVDPLPRQSNEITMKEAIQKAIEGGYSLDGKSILPHKQGDISIEGLVRILSIQKNRNFMFLDPLFWQALGKAEGWEEYPHAVDALAYAMEATTGKKRFGRWQKEWHRFIDHLAEGKDADSFFTNLIK